MQTEPTAGVSIFANYASQDIAFQQELKEHLRSLQQAGLIELWPDRVRSAETAWERSRLFAHGKGGQGTGLRHRQIG